MDTFSPMWASGLRKRLLAVIGTNGLAPPPPPGPCSARTASVTASISAGNPTTTALNRTVCVRDEYGPRIGLSTARLARDVADLEVESVRRVRVIALVLRRVDVTIAARIDAA